MQGHTSQNFLAARMVRDPSERCLNRDHAVFHYGALTRSMSWDSMLPFAGEKM
jgi:hypothetical protein